MNTAQHIFLGHSFTDVRESAFIQAKCNCMCISYCTKGLLYLIKKSISFMILAMHKLKVLQYKYVPCDLTFLAPCRLVHTSQDGRLTTLLCFMLLLFFVSHFCNEFYIILYLHYAPQACNGEHGYWWKINTTPYQVQR